MNIKNIESNDREGLWFLEYTKKWYLGQLAENETISDSNWESRRALFEDKYGSFFHYIDFGSSEVRVKHSENSIFVLPKVVIKGNFLNEFRPIFETKRSRGVWLPKMDGSSIVLTYRDGKFYRAATKSDEGFGIDKTLDLIDLVPQFVDPAIETIRVEALVPVELVNGAAINARSKANGLINSEYLGHEIEEKLFLKALKVELVKGHPDKGNLRKELEYYASLPAVTTRNASGRKVCFSTISFINNLDEVILDKETLQPDNTGYSFVYDGFVHYDLEDNKVTGYKVHVNETIQTRIIDIQYNVSDKGTYAPTVIYETIFFGSVVGSNGDIVPGRRNDRCSPNSLNIMFEKGMGVGALVEVGLSGATIPQIISVIEPSNDFNLPKCDCGSELGFVGAVFKCKNPECSKKASSLKNKFWNHVDSNFDGEWEDWVSENPYGFLNFCLNIDRLNIENQLEQAGASWDDAMAACYSLVDGDTDKTLSFLGQHISMTDLMIEIYNLNAPVVKLIFP